MKVKICGLTRPEDIAAVNQYRPDYAGFVFAPGKRQLSFETAMSLKALMTPTIQSVGVFVNAPLESILKLADRQIINLIQLHGNESEEYAYSLIRQTDLPVIKAIRVNHTEDILNAQHFPCSYLLLDTYVKGIYGGSGLSFDWSLIPQLEKPYFLAGGINLKNIPDALKTGAYSLDLSSAAETDGKKDPIKIRTIIEMIRRD